MPLRFRGALAPDLPTGSRVRIEGDLADGTVTASEVTVVATADSRTLGPQDVLVILFNFSNNPTQAFASTTVASVNDQVRSFYLESTYGQTSLSFSVAGWYTIARVDVKTRAVHLLRKEPWMAVGCIDGLYLTGPRELTGIQNCVHDSGRVLRIRLDRDLERIHAVDVLESYNPLFEGITTAAPAGRDLHFVANTQMRRAGPPFDPIRVLRLALDARGQALRRPSRP